MKNLYLAFMLLFGSAAAGAQASSYYFNGNFNENTGNGPALSEVLACSAVPGSFGSSIINTVNGNCGTGAKPVFNFTQGAGLSYPNGQVTGTYTLYVLFSFNNINGYRRIIDFLNGQTDVGLYILDGSLNFFPNGNVGTLNSFAANTFQLLTLVRDGATNQIEIYLNGSSFGTYSDAAGNYAAATITTPIVLFRDNIAANAQCESSAGAIKYFSIEPAASSPAQVAAVYSTVCSIALPLKLLRFAAAGRNDANILDWQTAAEMNTRDFAIQRSRDGLTWETAGQVPAQGSRQGTYTYTDAYPPAGVNYYRLLITDLDGTASYSPVVSCTSKAGSSSIAVVPVPAQHSIKIISRDAQLNGETGVICDMQGREVYRLVLRNNQEVDISSWPAGIYSLRLPGVAGGAVRIVKQ